ncbi:hypothetical protein KC316_g13951 [Hortaea werneckii]|nr:hypothetical protein KC324_g11100 [Hortaea werneckii]KAI7234743.1 hypothetical protein KC330_g4650 [Hortaea werneckii]KAI7553882.1 hypothetical protein KC316_g13951 [Hortaea werneckii]RMY00170.1 hypothetical protein D0868_09149 [Hortaea werneckii]
MGGLQVKSASEDAIAMASIDILKGFMATKFLNPGEIAHNRSVVLATYRHLLRATGIAFRGDNDTLVASRKLAHESFAKNRRLELGGVEAGQGIEHAQGVAQILRENVVQGKNTGGENYKLNIHEHTQRLDNETAKQFKGKTKTFKEIKDASF